MNSCKVRPVDLSDELLMVRSYLCPLDYLTTHTFLSNVEWPMTKYNI